MTLRCPNCGGKRLVYLSMTDGTAVGSTDQRYLCKDCGYRGSFVVEIVDTSKSKKEPRQESRPVKLFMLIILDIVFFLAVLSFLLLGQISTSLGLAVFACWVVVFLITVMSFSAHIAQGSIEWYQQGATIMTGIVIAIVIGLLLRFDVYGIIILIPFTIMGAFAVSWMFIDRSEDAITKDLEKLRKEIQ